MSIPAVVNHTDKLSFALLIITFKMTLEMRLAVGGRAIEGNEEKKREGGRRGGRGDEEGS